jgi:hypothetical protein
MAITITNDAASTRTNLGLGDAATKTTGTGAGNVPLNSNLSTVAASGAYADVSGTPTFKTVGGTSIEGSGNIESLPTGGSPGQVVTNTSSGAGTWQDAATSNAGTSAFHAKSTEANWKYAGAGSKVNLTATNFNIGNNYSTTDSRYIAPADGLYVFSFNIYCAQTATANSFTLYVDGGKVIPAQHPSVAYHSFAEGESGDHIQTSTITLNLTANQYVEPHTENASDWYTGHTFWTGFRLS